MNRKNLEKLARGLMQPELPAKFDMDWFCEKDGGYDELGRTECGSVGCAVGLATLLITPKEKDESWMEYARRLFGLPFYGEIDDSDSGWSWCFESDWARVDNTPLGAASRIFWLLDEGEPENAFEQQQGDEPLCYIDADGRYYAETREGA